MATDDPLPPDPAALVLLAEIADAGSVTEAARRLGVSQPAVSKQLRRLEQALGVTLFERGLRGIQPTEYGHALLPRARAIRTQARQAGEEVQQRRGLREGKLEIALSHFATIALLPRVMPAFRERWPGVQLSIVPPTFQLGGLREGRPDFAVMSMPAERLGAEYSARPLYATTVAVVLRPGHPLAGAKSLAELREAQWLLPSLESSVTRGLVRAFRQARIGTPQCAMTCQTLTGLETIATHTDLVAAMPLEVHEARASSTGLKRLPLAEPIEGPRVAILRWADAKPTPASADLEEAFVQAAHQMARAGTSRRRA
ncbi:LysR family transcriptional regulator [Ramlibacter sp. G-1-2-2]|uniref:LysR family transcriptional regulator n=1 Tax=Ramlibacter agri TaxID=2728837 RepID=A0A848H848_9BURK|nr:LysR family transcriptional regulator [Ramlibacter agri]NML46122.1 LysR family transcriptional regulator [Ramlibacter agri]